MRITKKTDEELNAMGLLAPGYYQFEVIEAAETISKAGNEMIKLTLKIWDEHGKERKMFDYLLDSMARKLKHFCVHTGQADKYENASLDANNCYGKTGTVQISIEKGKPNPNGGMYEDRNSVVDYVAGVEPSMSTPLANTRMTAPPAKPDFDDDVPF
jgi:hypothetical protein